MWERHRAVLIRWGPDGWQDMLRETARCGACGKRGVALQHPSWGGSDTGWAPMPISQMAPVPRLDELRRPRRGERDQRH
jgi:hypothetical protein